MAEIIDGKAYATRLRAKVAEAVADLKRNHGLTPGLAVVLVGENPASQVYVRNKAKQTIEAGMESLAYRLPDTTNQGELLEQVEALRKRYNLDEPFVLQYSRWLNDLMPFGFRRAEDGAYLSVPDASELKKRFNASQYGLLIADPAMADFVADVKAAIVEASKQNEAQGGVNIESLLAIPRGNITIAGLAGGPKGLGYVVMLDFGTSRSTVDKLIAKVSEGLANEGATKTQVEVGDFSITNFKLSVPKADPDAPGASQPPKSLTNLGWSVVGTGALLYHCERCAMVRPPSARAARAAPQVARGSP